MKSIIVLWLALVVAPGESNRVTLKFTKPR
jgi:hypothetical protein